MKNNYCTFLLLSFLLISCSNTLKNSELIEISVDTDQTVSLQLSEITENVRAVELETTVESMINPDRISRVLTLDGNVIIVQSNKILLFNPDGKFIRSIGSKGQGPGEFISIRNVAADEKNNRLFVISNPKIICYNINGNFLRESSLAHKTETWGSIKDINYINDEVIIIVDEVRNDDKGSYTHSVIYRLNDDLNITDSCAIRDTKSISVWLNYFQNYVLQVNSNIYLFYPYTFMRSEIPVEKVFRDTLYLFKNNALVPEYRLKFSKDLFDGEGKANYSLYHLYRSSRYVFALYYDLKKDFENCSFCFCYDSKTGKGYNMQDGFVDDIYKIDKRVKIRPFISNTDLFYYWHTNMKPDDREEPNPTLYVGRLKK